MGKLLNYLKLVSVFLIIELMLTFIISLLNLLGLNSGITTIIMLIFNLILFFGLSFYNAFKIHKKGLLEGLFLGIILILLMFLIKLVLLNNDFGLSTLIYYFILLITSVLGGMFGVNKKSGD